LARAHLSVHGKHIPLASRREKSAAKVAHFSETRQNFLRFLTKEKSILLVSHRKTNSFIMETICLNGKTIHFGCRKKRILYILMTRSEKAQRQKSPADCINQSAGLFLIQKKSYLMLEA